MLHFTANCRFDDLTARCLFSIIIVKEVFDEEGVEFWIASADDSGHSKGSKHYIGDAYDVRTRNMAGGYLGSQAQRIYQKLRTRLAPCYDVVLEKDHLHIEYDPK